MKEGSRNGASLSKGTPWGEPGGRAPLLGTAKDMLKRYIKRDVKMPCKQVSISTGTPLGNLEGIRLWGLFGGKDSISGFLSWTQRTIEILSLEAIWKFGKGTGLSWADIRLWGTKGPFVRPRCIGTIRAWTQCQSTYLPICLPVSVCLSTFPQLVINSIYNFIM